MKSCNLCKCGKLNSIIDWMYSNCCDEYFHEYGYSKIYNNKCYSVNFYSKYVICGGTLMKINSLNKDNYKSILDSFIMNEAFV